MRKLKAYPITEGELGKIFGIGVIATICFSAASGLLGLAIDVTKELAFTPHLSPTALGFWDAVRKGSFAACAVLAVAGVILIIWRQSVVRGIKRETTFPGN